MSRDIAGALSTAYNSDSVRPFLLCELEFGAETIRFWTGYGDLSWDSKTWQGSGTLIQVSSIEESYEVKASGINITLSGVPSDMLSLALGEEYHGRDCTVYMGALNEDSTVITDPAVVFRGIMDTMQINDNGEDSTINLTVENRLIDLERPRVSRYTSENQKSRFPSDRGLDFVTSLQDQTVVWGRE